MGQFKLFMGRTLLKVKTEPFLTAHNKTWQNLQRSMQNKDEQPVILINALFNFHQTNFVVDFSILDILLR